ncbi:MAG TPA: HK97-gp10 family putative phage morphogenesis protein [Candidatus Paceibacterota bacterium]|nr:HK97-gp10 family putative phage morphogenesis protein [Candidatus Paceibacterota bacterium]
MSVVRKQYVDMAKVARDAGEYTVQEVAFAVQGQAVALAPKDTSNLASSIDVKRNSDVESEVYTNVEYAIYQEFGTRNMEAANGKGYMRPAVDEIKSRLAKIWRQTFRRAYASNKR